MSATDNVEGLITKHINGKRCATCGKSKPRTAFTRQKMRNGKYNLNFECKECACDRQAKRYQTYTKEQKLHKKDKFLQRTYGITIDDYNIMFNKQEGRCASCGRHQSEFKKSLVVDHRHSDGKVRGLLCSNCNLALGNVKENPEFLEKLANYIRNSV